MHSRWNVLGAVALALLVACAPSGTGGSTSPNLPSSQPGFAGNWRGKDPFDGSNLLLTVSQVAGTAKLEVNITDDATDPGWCGVPATGTFTGELNSGGQLPANVLWTCQNAAKTARVFATVISYNASSDTLTAYDTAFVRVR